MTRGYFCCNPMNIMQSQVPWKGEIHPTTDPKGRLATFDSMKSGIRAGAKTLLAYYQKHSLSSVLQIISRYAPPNENDTVAYISDVCNRTGFTSQEKLNVEDEEVLKKLVMAIIHHEQGSIEYSDADLDSGVKEALC